MPDFLPAKHISASTTRAIRLLASAAIMAGSSAFAGNVWTGGGASGNWSDNNNWGGGAPAYGTLTFTTGGTQGTTSNNNSITSMNKLLWTGSATWTMNGSSTLSLFDNGGLQAKIENQSTGLVTINAPITFAANNGTPPNPYGEINAVNGDITFGTGTLTVNGTSVNGIKLFGAGRTTTFNNTVSATGKWFGLTGTGTTMAVGGAFTSGDIYVMNSGTLKLNSGGTITTSAIRLGGDFGNTGNQNQTLGGTFQLAAASGGLSFGSTINSVTGNTSAALLVDSANTSGTNTLSGNIFLDSNLKIQQASGGTLSITSTTLDVKPQTLSLGGGGNINISSVISSSGAGGGQLVIGTNGTAGGPTVTLSNASTYNGQTFVRAGTLAFTSAGSVANSTLRFGSTSGASVDANINLTTAAGGTTISSTINPVTTSGSGLLTLNSQNTSGTNTLSGHFGLDRDLTITQSSGGLLDITQSHTDGGTNLTGVDVKTFTLSLGGAGTINFNDIYNGTGAGTGNVVMNGSGTATLQGIHDNTSVATTVNSGTLVFAKTSSGTVHATAAVTVAGGTAKLGGTGGDQIFDSSNVAVTSGALDLNDRTETIATLNAQGSGISSAGALLNSGSGSSTLTTTTTNLTGSTTMGATGSGASVILSGGAANVNSSNQTLTQSGAGTLTISNGLAFSSSSGTTFATSGTSAAKTNLGALVFASGTSAMTLSGSAFTLTANVTNSSTNLQTINNNIATTASRTFTTTTGGGDIAVGGNISGTGGGVATAGPGTLTLSGTNTYTGPTTVSAGKLLVNGSITSATTVQSGGTLGGSGTITGNVSVQSGGTLSPGNSPGVLTVDGDLTLSGTTAMEISGTTRGTQYDGINIANSGHLITLGGTLNLYFPGSPGSGDYITYSLFNFGGGNTVSGSDHFGNISIYYANVLQTPSLSRTGQVWTATIGTDTYTFNEGFGSLVVVPEPPAYGCVIGLLMGGLIWLRRRRRQMN